MNEGWLDVVRDRLVGRSVGLSGVKAISKGVSIFWRRQN